MSIPNYSNPANFNDHTLDYDRRLRSWTNTPGYSAIPHKKRNLPVNQYTDEQIQAFQTPLTQRYTATNGSSVDFYHYNNVAYFSGTEILNRRNALFDDLMAPKIIAAGSVAHNKLLVKAADLKVNLPVMAAEAKKTSDLILQTAKRVADSYKAFRKGNFKKVASLLNIKRGTVHKNWLEYKYGWMPLLMDVKGSAEYFAQQQFYGSRPAQFVVSVKERGEVYFTDLNHRFRGYGGADAHYDETFVGSFEVRRLARFEVMNSHLSTLEQLGLTNPLLVVWELVPFSFVFDWFISVGDYLTGLSALQELRCVSYMHSGANQFEHRWIQPRTLYNDGTYIWYMSDWNRGSNTRSYARSPIIMSGPDVPRLDTTSLGFQKLVTSLALLKAVHRR